MNSKSKYLIFWVLVFLVKPALIYSQDNFVNNISDKSILAIIDKFRKLLSYDKEYQVTCQVATFMPEKKPILKKYLMYSKNEKTLLVGLEPERDRGKKILMIKDQLWQYFPKIQKTMTINSSMILSGNVNFTDIISSSLFQFYKFSEYKYNEKLKSHILTFTATSRNSPYGKLVYFYSGTKIDYFEAYARSGILLKKVFFIKYDYNEQNELYPVQIKIENALQDGDYSLVQMSSLKLRIVPDYYFNASSLNNINE